MSDGSRRTHNWEGSRLRRQASQNNASSRQSGNFTCAQNVYREEILVSGGVGCVLRENCNFSLPQNCIILPRVFPVTKARSQEPTWDCGTVLRSSRDRRCGVYRRDRRWLKFQAPKISSSCGCRCRWRDCVSSDSPQGSAFQVRISSTCTPLRCAWMRSNRHQCGTSLPRTGDGARFDGDYALFFFSCVWPKELPINSKGSIGVILSHRIQLDPTVKQQRYFAQAAGTSRLVWNWGVAEWIAQYELGGKPKASELKRYFNSIKYARFPWMKDIHRDAHSQPFTAIGRAFANFFSGRAEYPKFKKKGRCRDCFYVANDKLRLDGTTVRIPVIGMVRMRESLRFAGIVQSATVSREADRWFIAIMVEMADPILPSPIGEPIGIDLGLATFATLSTGEKIVAPKPLKWALRKLRRLGRWHSRKQLKSHNRAKAAMRLAKQHRRIKNVRMDFLHKLSTRLAKQHQQLFIEDLNVAGMVKNHNLSRHIADASWSEFRRQLEYKTTLYGSTVTVCSQWFASSKTCSACGWKLDSLPLSQRVWLCPKCEAVHDRDVNAAVNLIQNTEGYSGIDACGEAGASMPLVEAGTLPCADVCAQER